MCHHHSGFCCQLADTHIQYISTHIPTISPSVTSEIWQRQAGRAVTILTSSSWGQTLLVCVTLPRWHKAARVCVPTHFLFLRGTPSAQRTGQLTVGGNWACSANRKEKKNQTLKWQSVALVADWATTSPVGSPAFHPSPSLPPPPPPLRNCEWLSWMEGEGGGWVTGGEDKGERRGQGTHSPAE